MEFATMAYSDGHYLANIRGRLALLPGERPEVFGLSLLETKHWVPIQQGIPTFLKSLFRARKKAGKYSTVFL